MIGKKMYSALGVVAFALLLASRVLLAGGSADNSPLIPQLTVAPTFIDSTVPPNGDVNPYGVAFVPPGFPGGGLLRPGQIVVSNFNNVNNLQGTGTTIVRVNNGAAPSLFFQGSQGLGLTTALGVLRAGLVLVGDLPSLDGSGVCNAESGPGQNVGSGGLLVIDKNGNLIKELRKTEFLNGPWDLTLKDDGQTALVFVSNALSGTVTRLGVKLPAGGESLIVQSAVQIASGYAHRCDPAAFVVGPTGVALDAVNDILYVSSTADNAIFAIHDAIERTTDAGMGDLAVQDQAHLHGPLGLILAPNGDLISTQGDAVNGDPNQPSEIVEFTPAGQFVAQFSVDPAQGGAFGLAVNLVGNGFVFAAVDDNVPDLDVWVVH